MRWNQHYLDSSKQHVGLLLPVEMESGFVDYFLPAGSRMLVVAGVVAAVKMQMIVIDVVDST